MPTHEVQEGECIASIAEKHKFFRWQSVYYHEQNAGLRKLRPDPDQLKKGDKVFVPELDDREELCETGKEHHFQLREVPTTDIHLQLEDNGELLANMKFELSYAAEGKDVTRTGYTTVEGAIEHRLPVDVKEAKLKVWTENDSSDPLTWELKIGDLDPSSEDTGAQDRLRNLGYAMGDEDGKIGEKTKTAITSFQEDYDLPVSGELDDRTRSELESRANG